MLAWLTLSCALLAQAAAPAAGDTSTAAQLGVFTLVVNEVPKGEVTIALLESDVWMLPGELAAAGVRGFAGQRALFDGREMVSLGSMSPAIGYRLDEEAIELRLTVDPAFLAPSQVVFGTLRPEGLELRTDTTAFANYAVQLTHDLAATAFLDAGVNAGGHLAHSTLFAGTRTGLVRGMTSVAFQQPQATRAMTLGDFTAVGGELGGTALLGGFSLGRAFELDPYFIRSPVLGLEGAALAPSTLDIYVNGTRVRSEALPPGPFTIEQLPVSQGRGAASYVVRDAFGGARSVSSDYYISPNVLAPGMSEFAYSVGFLRRDFGSASFSYGDPAFSLRHRQGLGLGATVGGRAEGSPTVVNVGASISGASLMGQLDVSAALSNTPSAPGMAGLLGYTYTSRQMSSSMTLRAQSDAYATLSLPPERERTVLELAAGFATPLPGTLSLSTRAVARLLRDQGPMGEASVAIGFSMLRDWQLLALLSESVQHGGPATAFHVSLQHHFGSSQSITIGGNGNLDAANATLDLARQLPTGNGVGYRVASAYGSSSRADIDAQVQGDAGRLGAALEVTGESVGAALDASGSLVMVQDLGVFATRPTGRSFAVLRVPGVEGVRGFRENHEVGRTDEKGTLFVPDLIPYYGNRLRIEHRDLPLNYEPGVIERVIAPPLLGGAVVEFTATPTSFVRGTVVVLEKRARVIPEYGELSVPLPDGPALSPVGKDGSFELEGVPPGVHRATITYGGGTCTFPFEVPASAPLVLELGELTCAR